MRAKFVPVTSHRFPAPASRDKLSSQLEMRGKAAVFRRPQYHFGFSRRIMKPRAAWSRNFVVFSVLIWTCQIGLVASTGDKIPLGKSLEGWDCRETFGEYSREQ